jgi:hypothetical protein
LPVDILRIILLANADTANDHDVMLRINPVNYAVAAELVLPITGQRATQRQAVSFRVDGELPFQDFSQLLTHTAIESSDVRCGA